MENNAKSKRLKRPEKHPKWFQKRDSPEAEGFANYDKMIENYDYNKCACGCREFWYCKDVPDEKPYRLHWYCEEHRYLMEVN